MDRTTCPSAVPYFVRGKLHVSRKCDRVYRLIVSFLIITLFTISADLWGQNRYFSIWKEGKSKYKIWADARWSSFEQKSAELSEQEFRLIDVEVNGSGNDLRYTALWQEGKYEVQFFKDMNWAEFTAKWEEMKNQRFRLVDMEVYFAGGRKQFLGVWREDYFDQQLVIDLDWESFRKQWEELSKQNFRLEDIETYVEDGVRKYGALFITGRDKHMLLNGCDQKAFEMAAEGFTQFRLYLVDMEIYSDNNQLKYIGVWGEVDGPQRLLNDRNWDDFLAELRSSEEEKWELAELEIYRSGSGVSESTSPPIASNPPTSSPPPTTPPPAKTEPEKEPPKSGGSGSDELTPPAEGEAEYGVGTYYADKFQGKPTASGEPYDKNKYTAAHRAHPFDTVCRVTNMANGKSVEVRVNDRGPFTPGYVIDISRVAAEKIDAVKTGTFDAKIEVVQKP